nr:anthranilate synthase component I family protein [Bacteroidota bacterium]
DALRDHIREGDVYEVNLCQEFYADGVEIDPGALFRRLVQLSPNPFSGFLRFGEKYVISSSMERFLKKEGKMLISQPIKGTTKRTGDPNKDTELRERLYKDEKERAENLMIVDLVRNDLSRSCIPGTVKVAELFGIYPYTRVFHMVSTVSGEMLPDVHWVDALRSAFPMGSMTGAPKVMAMALIEKYEKSKRGVYSGSVGYITPSGDFDFNVVIRTFLYNAKDKYISLHAGSAITYDSDPRQEYEECLVKIESLLEALNEG